MTHVKGLAGPVCALLPLVIAITACGGSSPTETRPDTPMAAGRFDMVAHFGKPLPDTLSFLVIAPATPGDTMAPCPELLLRETIDIAPDSTTLRTTWFGYHCPWLPSTVPDSAMLLEKGYVTTAGDSVALAFGPATPGASPTSIEYAHVRGDDVSVYMIRNGDAFANIEYPVQADVYRHE